MKGRVFQDCFLRFPDYDLDAWCERHGCEPFEGLCHACGGPLSVIVPFAHGHLRGLVANPCECGNREVPFEVARLFDAPPVPPRPKRKRRIAQVIRGVFGKGAGHG